MKPNTHEAYTRNKAELTAELALLYDAFSKFKLYNCVVARGTWAPGTKEKSTNNFTTLGTRGKAKESVQ